MKLVFACHILFDYVMPSEGSLQKRCLPPFKSSLKKFSLPIKWCTVGGGGGIMIIIQENVNMISNFFIDFSGDLKP